MSHGRPKLLMLAALTAAIASLPTRGAEPSPIPGLGLRDGFRVGHLSVPPRQSQKKRRKNARRRG